MKTSGQLCELKNRKLLKIFLKLQGYPFILDVCIYITCTMNKSAQEI